MDNIAALVAVEAEFAAKQLGDGASLEERARAAMKAAHTHWLAPDDQRAFLGACEGLARTATDEERERIEQDLRGLQRASALIGALQAGIAVDWESMAEEAEAKPENPLGLKRLWQETA